MEHGEIAGSFRDPAGRVFARDGVVYRQVNEPGRADYETLMGSGLYEALTSRGLLVPHEDLAVPGWAPAGACAVIQPAQCPMVAFPYEYCFSQLRDAALVTLAAQRATTPSPTSASGSRRRRTPKSGRWLPRPRRPAPRPASDRAPSSPRSCS